MLVPIDEGLLNVILNAWDFSTNCGIIFDPVFEVPAVKKKRVDIMVPPGMWLGFAARSPAT
jgi:hypothetical protein